jgi:hypothetical protein
VGRLDNDHHAGRRLDWLSGGAVRDAFSCRHDIDLRLRLPCSNLAAAFIGMLPIAFAVRKRTGAPLERTILIGLAIYMIGGSAVDLHAFLTGLVGTASVPSIGLRTALGLVLLWLAT